MGEQAEASAGWSLGGNNVELHLAVRLRAWPNCARSISLWLGAQLACSWRASSACADSCAMCVSSEPWWCWRQEYRLISTRCSGYLLRSHRAALYPQLRAASLRASHLCATKSGWPSCVRLSWRPRGHLSIALCPFRLANAAGSLLGDKSRRQLRYNTRSMPAGTAHSPTGLVSDSERPTRTRTEPALDGRARKVQQAAPATTSTSNTRAHN